MSSIKELKTSLRYVYKKDWFHLYKELKRLEKKADKTEIETLKKKINRSTDYRKTRVNRKPKLYYNEDLPVTKRRAEIVELIRKNQVVIISGQTGSGKTTQIPKFCLEAGCGEAGIIACTQPRRIAAISVATRLAEELKTPLGKDIGYKIRFGEEFSKDGYVKVLTDGMLLAETQGDRFLNSYDCIIIDEAHERSLNIDFILGILRDLIKKRKDLKIIITSATIDTEKFSKAFENAPVVEVSGRTFPVEVEYRETEDDELELSFGELAAVATSELIDSTHSGDILTFLPTEQDIKEAIEALNKRHSGKCEIIPLYARLTQSEQKAVFKKTVQRKIIVSTNIAETSLTIPGIKYVVDSGVARISQYSPQNRTMGLPISPISRSSADQRKGRCGRVENGVCVRLFSEADYNKRAQFTAPEIQRTNLAEVILRMISLKLNDVRNFPFIDSPPNSGIKDAYDLLLELGAIKKRKDIWILTDLGKMMAKYPIDPRDSRMILEAKDEECVDEITALAAVVSIHDPRNRPREQQGLADERHNRFVHEESDFLTLLNIWKEYQIELKKKNSTNGKIKKWCKTNFISYKRMREWRDIYRQLVTINKELEIKQSRITNDVDTYGRIHRSLLSGYLSSIALKTEKNSYRLTRDREGMIYPGSGLYNRGGEWVFSFEQVKTSRLFLRTVANIDVDWLERLGGTLCKKSYSSPYYSRDLGEVRALERVSLFGLPIVYNRDVSYGRYNKMEATAVFIKSCLVEGDLTNKQRKEYGFLDYNLTLIERISKMENKLRQRNILVDETAIEKFYSEKLTSVSSLNELTTLIRKNRGDKFLKMKEEDLYTEIPGGLEEFPDTYTLGENTFKIDYHFDPGKELDGVTIKVPASVSMDIPKEKLDLAVPGLLKDRITGLIKGLPKEYRKRLIPVNATVDDIIKNMNIDDQSLHVQLSNYIYENWRFNIPVNTWDDEKLPEHLKVRISIIDNRGKEIKSSRDGEILYNDYTERVNSSKKIKRAKEEFERSGLIKWDFKEPLEEKINIKGITYYPGFKVNEDTVSIKLFNREKESTNAHMNGLALLAMNHLKKQLKAINSEVKLQDKYKLLANYFGGEKALYKQFNYRLLRKNILENIRTSEDFEERLTTLSSMLYNEAIVLNNKLNDLFETYQSLRDVFIRTKKSLNGRGKDFIEDVETEFTRIIPENFLMRNNNLMDIQRYLKGLKERMERGSINLPKDRERREDIRWFENELNHIEDDLSPAATLDKLGLIDKYKIYLEEYRLLLYAPNIKRSIKISDKKLETLLDEIERTI